MFGAKCYPPSTARLRRFDTATRRNLPINSTDYLTFLNYNGNNLYMATGPVPLDVGTSGELNIFAKFRFNSGSSWSRLFDCANGSGVVSFKKNPAPFTVVSPHSHL